MFDDEYCQYYSCSQIVKGYAGVALLSKIRPKNVTFGMGVKKLDMEGRIITAEYDDFYFVSAYVPNSGS